MEGLELAIAVIFTLLGVLLLLLVVIAVAQWKLFTKAGVEGWKSIIPLYNTYKVIEIAFNGTKNWLFIGTIISFATGFVSEMFNIQGTMISVILLAVSIINIYINIEFVKRYASTGMAIASLFVPFIILPIIAFSSKYEYTPYTQEKDLLN